MRKEFTVVSLQREKVNYRFYFCIFVTLVIALTTGGVTQLSPIFLPFSFFLIFRLWKWYRKQQKQLNVRIEKLLRFFLESNHFYLTTTVEKYDKDNRIQKEKIISNSAIVGYLVREDEIAIRAYKQGDIFTDKLNGLDTSLSALLKLPLDKKIDTVTHCDYIFQRYPDKRLILSQRIPPIKGTIMPITERISYDISKVSHGLTVGGTGSGKSFFINYKILCYIQMGAILYIADPKSADLSLLRFVDGFEKRVGTEPNQIAKLLREVSDIMEERYRTHFSDISAL